MAKHARQVGALMATLALMSGCARGAASPAAAPVPATAAPTYTTPSYTDPYSPGGGGYPSTPSYDPNAQPAQPMTARIDKLKNGAFLGMGTLVADVTVMNPSAMPQTGTLKVSILDNGKSIKDFTEQITVPAGQTITREYKDPRWKADNASVAIIPDPNSANNGYGNTTQPGYGTGGTYDPYSSGSSGYPSTGYPSTGYPSTGYPSTGYPSTSQPYGSTSQSPYGY